MNCRCYHTGSEKADGFTQTIYIIIEHAYGRTKPACCFGSCTSSDVGTYYHDLARHYSCHTAQQYAFAMYRVGKQRGSYGDSRTAVDFVQYVGERQFSSFISYKIKSKRYYIAIQKNFHSVNGILAIMQETEQKRSSTHLTRIGSRQYGKIYHYIATECRRTVRYLHSRTEICLVAVMYMPSGITFHPDGETTVYKHGCSLRRKRKAMFHDSGSRRQTDAYGTIQNCSAQKFFKWCWTVHYFVRYLIL